MKLNVTATAISFGLLWGIGAMFLMGLANLIWPNYGREFLTVMDSVYPGYQAVPQFSQVLIGTGYGLVDGLVCGAVLAWLYNLLAVKCSARPHP